MQLTFTEDVDSEVHKFGRESIVRNIHYGSQLLGSIYPTLGSALKRTYIIALNKRVDS